MSKIKINPQKLKLELIEQLCKANTKKDIEKICFNGLARTVYNESNNAKKDCISELCDAIDVDLYID